MQKDPKPYLQDILESIELIDQYFSEIKNDKDAFAEDCEKQDAVIRRLEIIGEAAKRLELEFKEQYPIIPWRKMTGLRDVLIHDYDQIDLDLIWRVVIGELPQLKQAVTNILDEL